MQGGTALINASYAGHDEVASLLLVAGASINLRQHDVGKVYCDDFLPIISSVLRWFLLLMVFVVLHL
jgi:ankyrin repeat protein